MVDYRIILLLSITVVLIWLSIVMYRRSREHIYFSLFVFSVGIWSFTLGMLYLSTSLRFLDFWSRMVYVSGSIIPVLFYYFSVVFTKRKIQRWVFVLLFLSVVLVSYVYLFTPLFLAGVMVENGFKGFVYGSARLVFDIYFDLIFLAGFLTMYHGLSKDKQRRTEFIFITAGTLFGLILAGSTNVVLPLFNWFEYLWAGPVGAAIWAAILTYGIVRHQLLDIKVIATELFTYALIFVLFIRLLLSQNQGDLIFNGALFLATSVLGTLLILAVTKEVRSREQIAQLAKQLQISNEELKKLDEAKSEFISISSHQLRAPLTVIKGYVSLFLEGSFGAVADAGKDALGKVMFATDQLVKLINDLLNLSRIESGKIHYDFVKVEFSSLVQKIMTEFQLVAQKRNKELIFQGQPEKEIYLYLDPDKIREVVVNLVDNAMKYSAKKISVSLKDGEGNKVRLIVTDDGMGLRPEDISRIFTKFIRTTEAQKLDPNGMGLGLYFVKRVVKDHGGKVWAESSGLGKGSTFIVELPVKK